MTPAQRYALGPFAGPLTSTGPEPVAIKIAERPVDANGAVAHGLYVFGVGVRHQGKTAIVVRTGQDVTIYVDDALAGEFRLDPSRRYQGSRRNRPPTPKPSPKS